MGDKIDKRLSTFWSLVNLSKYSDLKGRFGINNLFVCVSTLMRQVINIVNQMANLNDPSFETIKNCLSQIQEKIKTKNSY